MSSISLSDIIRIQMEAAEGIGPQSLTDQLAILNRKWLQDNYSPMPRNEMMRIAAIFQELSKNLDKSGQNIAESLSRAMVVNISSSHIESTKNLLKVFNNYRRVMAREDKSLSTGDYLEKIHEEIVGLHGEIADINQTLHEVRQEANTGQNSSNVLAIKLFIWSTIIAVFLAVMSNDQLRGQAIEEISDIFNSFVQAELQTDTSIELPTDLSAGELS